jgi:nicotinic acid phosphoribosyltransferase
VRLLADYTFDDDDLAWFATQYFEVATLDALRTLRFTGDVWAIAEGHAVLPTSP